MKINKAHPDLYKKYKDKVVINVHHTKGTIIGYYIIDDDVILVAQEDEKRVTMNLKQFMEFPTINIEDFHGDLNKNFFLINQARIDNGFIISIQ